MASASPDSYSGASGATLYVGRSNLTPATAITLTDVMADRIYQRVGTSKTITVSGTYTGAGSKFEVRAVPDGTAIGSTGYAWTAFTAGISGGTFSTTLNVPQSSGWLNLQVRDYVNNSVYSVGTNKFGVGLLVATIGQSNMVGLATGVVYYPNSSNLTRRTAGATATTWRRVGNYHAGFAPNTPSSTYGTPQDTSANTTTGEPYSSSGRGDGVVYMCNYLQATLGVLVGVLELARGGTSITTWAGSGSNWNNFITGANLVGGDFEAALWFQGENDAAAAMSTATYQGYLDSLYAALLSQTGRSSSTFGFGVVGLGPANTYYVTEGNAARIRTAQLQFVAANSNTYYASGAHDADLAGGDVHFIADSQGRMGKRYARGILAKLGLVANGIAGPYITGATKSGAVVTVNIAHVGGTSLADGAGGAGASLLGFRVYDDGSAATISSTSISGNTVVLTLSATPAGTVTMDYAMANAPYTNTRSLASVVYDNDTVTGDTLGLPLRPCATITVT